jgi:ornithine carbamoyltransferase
MTARSLPPRHFLDLDRFKPAELRRMLDAGAACKRGAPPGGNKAPFAGKALALVFENSRWA